MHYEDQGFHLSGKVFKIKKTKTFESKDFLPHLILEILSDLGFDIPEIQEIIQDTSDEFRSYCYNRPQACIIFSCFPKNNSIFVDIFTRTRKHYLLENALNKLAMNLEAGAKNYTIFFRK